MTGIPGAHRQWKRWNIGVSIYASYLTADISRDDTRTICEGARSLGTALEGNIR